MHRYHQLINHLRSMGPLGIAFSGGVDSTLLLKAAHDALGDRACAITINGPMHFRRELQAARELAQQLGVRQVELPIDWLELAELHSNPADRCYRCKRAILALCRSKLPPGYQLCEGSTSDDLLTHRPGRRALEESGVRSPLQELGLEKAVIRSVSHQLGLATWDKPAQSCLLTRFPHDTPLTPVSLQRVEACEDALHDLGFKVFRVRSLGDLARLEFGAEDIQLAQHPASRSRLLELCRQAGFHEATIDPAGYRCGSMD